MTPGYIRNKRWRKKHPKKELSGKKRYYQRFQNAKNSRNRWFAKEVDLITAPHRLSDRELCRILNRSVKAIQVKRCRLKKEKSA